MQLSSFYDHKLITLSEWKTGLMYLKIRSLVLRSKEIKTPFKKSSVQMLYETKGIVHDCYESSTLENFWKILEHFVKYDNFPLVKILDHLTGISAMSTPISLEETKIALKKIRKIFKSIDMNFFLEKIQKNTDFP